jgi:Glycosyl transferases group 1
MLSEQPSATGGARPLRSLVLAQNFPWPMDTGSMLRLAFVIGALGSLGTVELFCTVPIWRETPTDLPPSAPVARWGMSIYPARAFGPLGRARRLVTGDPLELAGRRFPLMQADLEAWAEGPYDVVWVSKAITYVVLGEPRLGPTIVDVDDLEDYKIRARVNHPSFAQQYPPNFQGRAHAALAKAQASMDARNWSALQRRIASSVDAVALCSELDRARFPYPNVVIVPNVYEPPDHPVGRVAVSATPTVVFQGVLGYPPNADASRWLAGDIGPRLRQLRADAQIRLVGADYGGIRNLHDPPRVTTTGWVPEMVPELAKADVIAVPLRFGSGTRLKILEAFAHRIPVVSTTLGAEGLEVRDGEHLLLADTTETFAAACARLLQDRELRAHLVDNASSLLSARYSLANARARIVHEARRLTGQSSSEEPVAR